MMKVIVVGNGQVGKTCLITRFVKDKFSMDYKKTLGVDYLQKLVQVDGEEVMFHLWDTAGQEEFNALTRRYYRGASACVLAFATNNRDSFEAVRKWREAVNNECSADITTVLVQTKVDLIDEAQVSEIEVEALASEFGIPLFRVCSKENTNVKEVFHYLASTYFGQQKHLEEDFVSPITNIHDLKKNKSAFSTVKPDTNKVNNGRVCITVGQAKDANTILQGRAKLLEE